MITNEPIPADAKILRISRTAWEGRPCLITRYEHAGKQWDRMDWMDELDSRWDSLANYLRTPVSVAQGR